MKQIELLIDRREFSFKDATVRDAFKWAQSKLAANYRNEYFYKSVLIEKIVLGKHSPKTVSVYNEFKVADSRADLILVNGSAVVYEIKTNFDDLSKAKKQAVDYFSCFKNVVFVVDESYVDAITYALPEQVGILCISARGTIKTVRSFTPKSDLLSNRAIFSCLHRNEYEDLIRSSESSVDTKRYDQVVGCIDRMDTDRLSSYFTRCLRERRFDSKAIDRLPRLPSSLWAAAYSYKLTAKEWESFIDVLDRAVAEVI